MAVGRSVMVGGGKGEGGVFVLQGEVMEEEGSVRIGCSVLGFGHGGKDKSEVAC